nr:GNAT family N-acetyltransferase [Pseudomarimonas arenosa]
MHAVPAADWDALRGGAHPLLSHTFLAGLEQHGCLQRRYGWRPYHLLLHRQDQLIAAAPLYLKGNSHGEFVFDHGWAEAYHRYGVDYYPKLLCAIPYSPVNGPRLLCGQDTTLAPTLLRVLEQEVARLELSSAHINFLPLGTDEPDAPWLSRHDYQFHWQRNDASSFDAFLRELNAKKRKNIQQERCQVREAGIEIRRHSGNKLDEQVIAAMHGFYRDTFERKGNLPVLTPAFFQHLAETMPKQLMIALAYRHSRPIAGALFLYDSHTLFGRYWGASEAWPGLHFELCYYQGIEFCIEQGIDRFEPGAQGEHKVARGFLPTRTRSWHYIADSRFREAIARSLQEEAHWVDRYAREVAQHTPFRQSIELEP